LNLDFYIKKKHLFKQRKFAEPNVITRSNLNYNYIYSVTKTRLEFVYIGFFKKLLRRRYIKAKLRFFKPKYWVIFLPNFILTQKSKNARMGAGVGKFIRLTSIISPGKSIIKTWYYNLTHLNYVIKYLSYKIKSKLLLKIVTNK
jgi:ribosomal protein L16/L10AE